MCSTSVVLYTVQFRFFQLSLVYFYCAIKYFFLLYKYVTKIDNNRYLYIQRGYVKPIIIDKLNYFPKLISPYSKKYLFSLILT